MKDKKIFSILLSFTLIMITGCSNEGLQEVTLMLDYTPNTNHSGVYVALKEGIYEDYGIDLKILQPGDIPVSTAVSQQQVDFAFTYQEDVEYSHDKDLDVISIMTIYQENLSGFVTKDLSVTSPKNFEGKTYCGWGSPTEEAIIKSVMEIKGGDFDELKIALTQTGFIGSDLEECQIFWEFENWANVQADLDGVEYNYFPLSDYMIDFYTPVIVTSNNLIENDPSLVANFAHATQEGYLLAAEDPDLAAQDFLEYNATYDEEFIQNSQEISSSNYLDKNNNFGIQEDQVWSDFHDWMLKNNIIENDFDYTKEYTNEFLIEN